MKIELTDNEYKFLKELKHELNTQENDGNADPVFWGVEETYEECRGDDGEYGGDPYITFDDGKWSLEEDKLLKQWVEQKRSKKVGCLW